MENSVFFLQIYNAMFLKDRGVGEGKLKRTQPHNEIGCVILIFHFAKSEFARRLSRPFFKKFTSPTCLTLIIQNLIRHLLFSKCNELVYRHSTHITSLT